MLPIIAPAIISVGKWLPDAYLKYPTADESSNDVPQIYGVRLESGLYLLNVVDAAVDAHLMTWEVDEDLSIRLEPEFYQPVYGFKPGGGLRLSLKF